MKKLAGFILLGLFALTIVVGTVLMVVSSLEVYMPESSFIAGFIMSIGGALIADSVLAFFEDEDEDEDE